MTVMDSTFLVLSATGRQGRAVIKALIAEGATSIVASSRDPTSIASQKLLEFEQVTKVVKADFDDPESIEAAINASNATHVWFTTDYWSIPRFQRKRAKEAQLGFNVIDAIKKGKVNGNNEIEHVVYSSVGDADNCPENINHFWAKADVEKYMAYQFDSETNITWSVIRPAAFFENADDETNYNPLKKSFVKMLTYPDKPVVYVAVEDIGKGSVVLLTNAEKYAGKIIEAAGAKHTGFELAAILTKVSGVKCTYEMTMPRFVLQLFMRDLYHMVKWIEVGNTGGFTADIREFKKIVPDAQNAEAFFTAKSQWADGEKFVSNQFNN
jgi:uncharacterized protein YbjT (DUF2867 family)